MLFHPPPSRAGVGKKKKLWRRRAESAEISDQISRVMGATEIDGNQALAEEHQFQHSFGWLLRRPPFVAQRKIKEINGATKEVLFGGDKQVESDFFWGLCGGVVTLGSFTGHFERRKVSEFPELPRDFDQLFQFQSNRTKATEFPHKPHHSPRKHRIKSKVPLER